jgi:predicted ester cyclase
MSEENKAILRRLFDEVWNGRNLNAIPEIYSPDFVAHYPPPVDFGEGLEGLRATLDLVWGAFPDYHEEVHQMVAEGDYVSAWYTITGTHEGQFGPAEPTGKRIEVDEIAIFKLRDGKVVGQRGVIDTLSMLQQLGVLPPLPGAEEPA